MKGEEQQGSGTQPQQGPREFLFVGYGDWHLWKSDGFRTRSAQLVRFLAHSNRVSRISVLNEPVYLRGVRKGFSIPRTHRFLHLPFRAGASRAEEKILLLDPSRFLVGPDLLKRPLTTRLVRKGLDLQAHTRPVLWIANVHKAFLMARVPSSIKVFDAIDDWGSVQAYQRLSKRIRAGYEAVLEQADIIFTVSRHLQQRFLEQARTDLVFHLPNGVDLGLFSDPAPPPSLRSRTRSDREPLLTYTGVLSERTDMDLVEQAARDLPHCRIRLVGPMTREVERRWKRLRRLSNLEWKGLVHHSEIPTLLHASDVLLLPHKRSQLSLSMDPLKLYEYLTTGLPVVATPVPPCEDYAHLIHVAEGKAFSERIKEALEECKRPDAESIWRSRIQETKRHGWEIRVAAILNQLDENF